MTSCIIKEQKNISENRATSDLRKSQESVRVTRKFCRFELKYMKVSCIEVPVLENGSTYPQKLRIRREVLFFPGDEHHRSVINPTTCKLPTDLTHSQLDCYMTTISVHCNQTCAFGHTLTDGIQREMKCWYDENKWTPVPEFEDCKPFVDCSVTMNLLGDMECYNNFFDKGPYCEIFCDHYEDKAPIPTMRYVCDIEGKWEPKLPFCVTPGSGLKLVPPPRGPRLIT